jgi:hypothetical protein
MPYKMPIPLGLQESLTLLLIGIATTGTIYKDVKDFELDLMLEGSTGGVQYNTFRSFLSAGFEYTGKQVTITENDSIIIKIKLVDIVPSYASGYFGKDTFKVTPDPVIFEAFKNFKEGALSFENVNLSLNVSSGAGVESKVVIDKIEGLNSTRNTRKTLSINQPYFSIPAAIETPFTKQTVSYQINVNNSSVRAFLENMPDKLFCEGTVITNPSADASVDPTTLSNFLNENSSFDISLSLDIPLSFNANNLTLADTTYLSKFDLKNIDKIKDATISLLLDNELPLSFKINMYVYDADNKLVDSLVSITPVAAAVTNPANGKLITSQKKQLDYYFDNQRLRTLLESKKVYFKAVMNSPTNDFYKINAGNELKVNIVGRFNYTMGVN